MQGQVLIRFVNVEHAGKLSRDVLHELYNGDSTMLQTTMAMEFDLMLNTFQTSTNGVSAIAEHTIFGDDFDVDC